MSNYVEVIILENGRCKTVNPFEWPGSEEPYVPFYAPYGMSEDEFFWERERAQDKWNEWNKMRCEYEQAESQRQEFEIEKVRCICLEEELERKCGFPLCQPEMKPNTIHRATIVNGKAQINPNQG